MAAKILRVQTGSDLEQQRRLEAQFKKELLGKHILSTFRCGAPGIPSTTLRQETAAFLLSQ